MGNCLTGIMSRAYTLLISPVWLGCQSVVNFCLEGLARYGKSRQ
jgi:hypothetical protein